VSPYDAASSQLRWVGLGRSCWACTRVNWAKAPWLVSYPQIFWASHAIGHELSAFYDAAHGAGLAVIFPAWMKFVYRHDIARFAQFANRVWEVESDHFNPEKTALEGIRRTEAFFRSLCLPSTLTGMGLPVDRFAEIAAKCTVRGKGFTGKFVKLDPQAVIEILTLAK